MGGKNRNANGKFVGLVMAVTLMLVFSAVGVVTTADDTRQDDSELILRVAMQDDIRTTNPLNAGGVWTWNVIGYLYDGPINVDPATEKLVRTSR